MHAFLFIAGKRREREQAEALAIGTMASRGDPKAIKKRLKDISEE